MSEIVEIECMTCHKKVMRKKSAKKCFDCLHHYTPVKNDVEMICSVCKSKFKSTRFKNQICSNICKEILRNNQINGNWLKHESKKNGDTHPWKGTPAC